MSGQKRLFEVARNPDPASRLPYLVRLPLPGGDVVLKAREPWPRTGAVYCHPADGEWPGQAELVERVPVRSCRRRGGAIDLVLDRPREHRSQLVYTRVRVPGHLEQARRAAHAAMIPRFPVGQAPRSLARVSSTSMPCRRSRFSPRILRLACSVSCG